MTVFGNTRLLITSSAVNFILGTFILTSGSAMTTLSLTQCALRCSIQSYCEYFSFYNNKTCILDSKKNKSSLQLYKYRKAIIDFNNDIFFLKCPLRFTVYPNLYENRNYRYLFYVRLNESLTLTQTCIGDSCRNLTVVEVFENRTRKRVDMDQGKKYFDIIAGGYLDMRIPGSVKSLVIEVNKYDLRKAYEDIFIECGERCIGIQACRSFMISNSSNNCFLYDDKEGISKNSYFIPGRNIEFIGHQYFFYNGRNILSQAIGNYVAAIAFKKKEDYVIKWNIIFDGSVKTVCGIVIKDSSVKTLQSTSGHNETSGVVISKKKLFFLEIWTNETRKYNISMAIESVTENDRQSLPKTSENLSIYCYIKRPITNIVVDSVVNSQYKTVSKTILNATISVHDTFLSSDTLQTSSYVNSVILISFGSDTATNIQHSAYNEKSIDHKQNGLMKMSSSINATPVLMSSSNMVDISQSNLRSIPVTTRKSTLDPQSKYASAFFVSQTSLPPIVPSFPSINSIEGSFSALHYAMTDLTRTGFLSSVGENESVRYNKFSSSDVSISPFTTGITPHMSTIRHIDGIDISPTSAGGHYTVISPTSAQIFSSQSALKKSSISMNSLRSIHHRTFRLSTDKFDISSINYLLDQTSIYLTSSLSKNLDINSNSITKATSTVSVCISSSSSHFVSRSNEMNSAPQTKTQALSHALVDTSSTKAHDFLLVKTHILSSSDGVHVITPSTPTNINHIPKILDISPSKETTSPKIEISASESLLGQRVIVSPSKTIEISPAKSGGKSRDITDASSTSDTFNSQGIISLSSSSVKKYTHRSIPSSGSVMSKDTTLSSMKIETRIPVVDYSFNTKYLESEKEFPSSVGENESVRYIKFSSSDVSISPFTTGITPHISTIRHIDGIDISPTSAGAHYTVISPTSAQTFSSQSALKKSSISMNSLRSIHHRTFRLSTDKVDISSIYYLLDGTSNYLTSSSSKNLDINSNLITKATSTVSACMSSKSSQFVATLIQMNSLSPTKTQKMPNALVDRSSTKAYNLSSVKTHTLNLSGGVNVISPSTATNINHIPKILDISPSKETTSPKIEISASESLLGQKVIVSPSKTIKISPAKSGGKSRDITDAPSTSSQGIISLPSSSVKKYTHRFIPPSGSLMSKDTTLIPSMKIETRVPVVDYSFNTKYLESEKHNRFTLNSHIYADLSDSFSDFSDVPRGSNSVSTTSASNGYFQTNTLTNSAIVPEYFPKLISPDLLINTENSRVTAVTHPMISSEYFRTNSIIVNSSGKTGILPTNYANYSSNLTYNTSTSIDITPSPAKTVSSHVLLGTDVSDLIDPFSKEEKLSDSTIQSELNSLAGYWTTNSYQNTGADGNRSQENSLLSELVSKRQIFIISVVVGITVFSLVLIILVVVGIKRSSNTRRKESADSSELCLSVSKLNTRYSDR